MSQRDAGSWRKFTENSTNPAVTWPILSDYLAESFEKNSLALGVGRNLKRTSSSRVESESILLGSFSFEQPILQTFENVCISCVGIASRKSVWSIEFRKVFTVRVISIFVYIHCIVDYAIIDWPLSNHRVATFPK